MKRNFSFKLYFILITIVFCFANEIKAQTSEQFLIGNWMGNIEFQGKKLALVFRVKFLENDSVIAFMDSPDQGAKDIKVSKIKVKNDSVFIRVKSLGVSISGILNSTDSTISGIFRQSILNCPITLKKIDKIPEINRPQEPKPPFAYTIDTIRFENSIDKIALAGTLTTPKTSGKFPAVVLITGSGPQNRDEELMGHKPFLVIADYLTRNGIAVLRYDDRGIAKSKGDFASATSYDFANDAEAAVNYLKTLNNIYTNKIGLIGHSEGGMIAPLIASRNKSVGFIVLLAGPGLSGEEILIKQSALIARASKESEEDIADAMKLNKMIYKIINKEKDNSIATKKIRKVYDKHSKASSTEEKLKAEMQRDAMIQQILTPWFRTFLSFDPKKYLTNTHCAVLALNGGNDLQVPPDEDLAAIEKYLKKAGNKHYMIKKLPNLNHLFQTCKTGSPDEYAKIEETFSPDALLIVKEWIKENTK
ncbi:MAG: alpha/beta hydrolase [Bacteroidetes bacterium]|nr:alpha/beta hydrolase [Bacteroidota bacterium]